MLERRFHESGNVTPDGVGRWCAVHAREQRPGGLVVVLTLEIVRDGDQWIGKCVELGPATSGDSPESTRGDLIKLVELHLNAIERAGKREDAFRERRVEMHQA